MLLEMHLGFKHVSNATTSTSVFFWDEFDFHACDDYEVAKVSWAVSTILCFAVGFPACIAILWEMFKMHRRGSPLTPNHFFILNLSAMDVIFLAFIPFGLLNHFILHSWVFEAFWNAVYSLNICGRPLLMACVCLDCYVAVVHPITHHQRKSLAPRVVMAGIIWTWTFASAILYLLFYKLYYTMFPIVHFMIAVVIIGICDSLILHALVTSGPGSQNVHPQKQRAIQTLINSLVITVISYLPPILMSTIGSLLISHFKTFMCNIGIPITIFSTLGSGVMPILHLKNNGKLVFWVGWCRKS